MEVRKTIQENLAMNFVLSRRSLRWVLLAHVLYVRVKSYCANSIRRQGNSLTPYVTVSSI